MNKEKIFESFSIPYFQQRTEKRRLISLKFVNQSDILDDKFQKWSSTSHFDPKDFKMCGEQKSVAREIVIKVMEYLVDVSNSKLMKNFDHLLSQMEVQPEFTEVGKISNELMIRNFLCFLLFTAISFMTANFLADEKCCINISHNNNNNKKNIKCLIKFRVNKIVK